LALKHQYYILHKPYGYLSQFKDEGKFKGLVNILNVSKDVYSVGRLDATSEGLLLLTNDTSVNDRLLNPKNLHKKVYYVQVEGEISKDAVSKLEKGVSFKIKGKTINSAPAKCKEIDAPYFLEERMPPVRERKSIPTSWISLELTEGKNRQVRRMTAAVGFPTLRLIRYSINRLTLDKLKIGEYRNLSDNELKNLFNN
jgi:23S rRNA pseudouridine2457 synthase